MIDPISVATVTGWALGCWIGYMVGFTRGKIMKAGNIILSEENETLRGHLQSMIDQTTPLVPVPGDPMWSRRITIDELRKALDECAASLKDEMLQKYNGQQPEDMHPVTRRNYDRDMAEIAGYVALSKEG